MSKPWITCLKSAIVFGERVLKIWSRSTSEVVWESGIWPPSAIVSPFAGGRVRMICRPATEEREVEWICAVVPALSGA